MTASMSSFVGCCEFMGVLAGGAVDASGVRLGDWWRLRSCLRLQQFAGDGLKVVVMNARRGRGSIELFVYGGV